MTCILAIDPGITGALAFHYPEYHDRLAVYDMPIVDGNVNPHQIQELINIFRPDRAIIERVSPMPQEGVVSVWRFASAFTTACVVVKMANIALTMVPSSQWKRAMNLKGGKEGKEQARCRAIELFPFAAANFALKKHHGRAEAAILAVYAATQLRKEVSHDHVSSSQPIKP